MGIWGAVAGGAVGGLYGAVSDRSMGGALGGAAAGAAFGGFGGFGALNKWGGIGAKKLGAKAGQLGLGFRRAGGMARMAGGGKGVGGWLDSTGKATLGKALDKSSAILGSNTRYAGYAAAAMGMGASASIGSSILSSNNGY